MLSLQILVIPDWVDDPRRRRWWNSRDSYESNDQIPNTEIKKKERHPISEINWNSAGNTPREWTHTKHLLKYS